MSLAQKKCVDFRIYTLNYIKKLSGKNKNRFTNRWENKLIINFYERYKIG